MVLADSHTISKSIDNDNKLDNNIFESIHDVDRPQIKPKTRKDRQHKYKLHYSKDEDVVLPEASKEAKPYTGFEKITLKTTLNTTLKTTTEHAKHHKSSKRPVVGFWKKLRGKNKKKETTKHDSFDKKRTVSNHKKEQQKDSSNPGPKNKSWRKNRKKISLQQPEIKVTKRDVSRLFSTRPYSNTLQSYKLQMGIAPQVDNMLRSKYQSKVVQPFLAVDTRVGVTDNLQGQLASITSTIFNLKERYGRNPLDEKPLSTGSPSADNAETNMHRTTVSTAEVEFEDTAQIELMLNDMKARVIHLIPFQKPLMTDLVNNSVTETTSNAYPVFTRFGISAPDSGLSTFESINDNENLEITTVASTKSDEFNPNDSIFSVNTDAHYLAARSIKEDTMTIAQNVEDMLQRELKNIYNKVKHKVSNDLRKEIDTAKSTAKESYRKLSSKLSGKSKTAANATSSKAPCKTTSSTKSKTCPCKSSTKKKERLSSTTTITTTTTPPRVKKKDHTEEDKFIKDTYTPETVNNQTYDDCMMLTVFEQILSKSEEENVRKMLATSEIPEFAKNKREAIRLSKRNPETLTDVKLREVIQNLYDDGGNIPDYDYIQPSSNVSSTERTTANNNYNDVDYVPDPSATADNSADGFMVEANDKNKGATPTSADAEHADLADSDISAADSGNTASGTSYEGLSNKISYNEFVNGYKHYLNFQKDQNNQNFSNLIKYQAHRHHSVNDIGKYILNKIPPLPSYNKKKREQTFSDDSENNMDYQEITTKSDDSWFRKHFYLFIDNGPPKKYHTSETVELKPPSTETTLYIMMSEPTPGILPKDQHFIRIGSDGVARKAKHTQEISLDDLAKVLDSFKDKQTSDTSSKAKPNIQKDTFNPIDNYNGTDDATSRDKSIVSEFFAGKRRHAHTKDIETTEYFPDYMFTDSTQLGRLKRSIRKENLENTIMVDFINKDIEEKASTGAKEVLANGFSNRETNKFGYVDIDLVPRQTAIVKLRANAKKSRIKNFFNKFKFKKKKANPMPKRSCPQLCRRGRFNPIKKLKSMFNYKEEKEKNKEKEELTPDRLMNPDYDMVNSHMSKYKPIKFAKPLSIADMQKQIPNISDIYFEPETNKITTKLSSNYFHLDDKDQDLLYNYHPATSSSKPSVTSHSKPANLMIMTVGRSNATQASSEPSSSSLTAIISKHLMVSTNKKPEIQRIPPCNVMTVNLKTLRPSTTTSKTTEVSLTTIIGDMNFEIDNMQNKLNKEPENFPKVTTKYTPSNLQQTGKLEYKKNVQPLSPPKVPYKELLIKSKLTRIAKFPIKNRLYKKKRHNDSEIVNIGKDSLSFDAPSVLEYIDDLGNKNTFPKRRKAVKGNAMRKIHHSHVGKASEKDKNRYTDYFNDLLMWHNDILNLDTVPNPLWANILETVQSDTGTIYTTPNMNNLLIGLKEMNDYLDPGVDVNRSAVIISPNHKSLNPRWKDRVGVRYVKNQLNDQGIIRRVAMDDNTIVNSKDMLIKGEAKYYQYNKPKNVATKLSSSDFIMKLNRLKLNNYDRNKEKIQFKRKGNFRLPPPLNNSETAIIVDTTLMAYDDDVDSVTQTLEIKEQSRNSQRSFKVTPKNEMDHAPFLKTNKPPVQYYTTPLPMNSREFNKFLKEHQMDVDFVTSPMLELPTFKTTSLTQKKNKKPKPPTTTSSNTTKITFAAKTPLSGSWKTQATTSLPQLSETSELLDIKKVNTTKHLATKKLKTTKKKGFTQQIQSKIDRFTNALGKSVKFTKDQPKEKVNPKKPVNSIVTINMASYLENEFDRYKRYRELKVHKKATPAILNKATTQEVNYYSIFKKKMKERLFEKKATGPLDSPRTEPVPAEPRNKNVEITIINFDDIEKVTTHQPFDILTLPTLSRDEISTFANYGAVTTKLDYTIKSTDFLQKEKDNHNGLLYKDIFKERTSSTSTTDLTKSTEYVDPIVNNGQAIISNNNKPMLNRYPFEKLPMYPNILRKLPHSKNHNSGPKRVHISSHHYKYDVFYDDFKKTGKTYAGQMSRPKHSTSARPNGMSPIKLTYKRASNIFRKRTEPEVVKKIDRTSHKSRQKRKLWGRVAAHKKRKIYTFEPKYDGGGLTESTGCSSTPIILTPLYITDHADVSETRDEETYTSAAISTAVVSNKPHGQSLASAVVNTALVSEGLHEEPFTSPVDKTSDVFSTRRYTSKPHGQSLASAVVNTAIVSEELHEEPFTSAVDETSDVFLTRRYTNKPQGQSLASAVVSTALVSEGLHEEPFTSVVDETSDIFLTRRYTSKPHGQSLASAVVDTTLVSEELHEEPFTSAVDETSDVFSTRRYTSKPHGQSLASAVVNTALVSEELHEEPFTTAVDETSDVFLTRLYTSNPHGQALASAVVNTALVSEKLHQEPFISAVDETSDVFLPRRYTNKPQGQSLASAVVSTALVSEGLHEVPFTSVVDETSDIFLTRRYTSKPHGQSLASAVVNTALLPEELHEESFITAVDETSDVFLPRRYKEPVSDIEDVVTMLDGPDMAVTDTMTATMNMDHGPWTKEMSDIEDAVTLSAMRSELFTSITIRDSVRRAMFTPSTTVTLVPATKRATKPATKPATKRVTKPVTKHVTKPGTKSTTKPAPQLGSLVYNQKQLQVSTASSKPSKDKKKKLPSSLDKDGHRRLFKISALVQNRFKSLMKNLPPTTKRLNATTLTNATTQSPQFKLKRTCDVFPDSPSPVQSNGDVTEQPETKTVTLALADSEGFRLLYRPNYSTEQIRMPPTQDESEDVTPASLSDHKCKSNHEICDCELYVEPETYNDQLYYELGPIKCKCTNTTKEPAPGSKQQEKALHRDIKREVQTNTFTAKDVAALEVIVDLMKNTLSYEDNNAPSMFRHGNIIMSPTSTKPWETNASSSTNSIHVHIAIPSDFQNGKKRSPSLPGPVRVRKVFSAKMVTPVDLEYQVNSFEGTIASTSNKQNTAINATNNSLSPGMYLLVDKPRNGYALKPVLGQINLADLRARQALSGTTVSMTESKPIDTREETTSLKSLAKVTLSKDFVAAINEQLIKMYENLSRVNKDVNNNNIRRPARSVWKSRKLKENTERRKTNAENYIVKRRIDWEAVKQFFGHDRVCTCKCQSNKTMCRACAASDAVIDELIFEFDNIGRYMADHCTEIQTFFWMNPIGGQRLRESVNKIDKSLSDYYKRVKGKCQGRLCKCFSNCIDKRQFIKIANTKKEDTMSGLVNDLAILAEDLNRTIALKVCYNGKLKENGDKFLHFMNNCIMTKPMNKNKRSNPNTTPQKLIKNVYSLDNINVNIICNPESSTATDVNMLSDTTTTQENARPDDHILDFDPEEPKYKKNKGFKKILPRKSKKAKLLSYFEFKKKAKPNYKRQVDNQVATPLISDGGGAFWYDYLKTGTNEPRLARDSIKNTPNIEIADVQKGVTTEALSEKPSNNDLGINTTYITVKTPPERNQRDLTTTTDSLSRNINQMLQLIGSLQDVEAMNKNPSQTGMMLRTETVIDRAVSEDKQKEQSLTIVKNVKQNMDRAWSKEKQTNFTVPQHAKQNINPAPEKKSEELATIKQMINAVTHNSTSKNRNATTDLKSRDDALIISKVTRNVTTIKMTTARSPVTNKTLPSTHSVETNNTRLATTIAPKSDGKSESPLIFGNESTKKLGFMKKLKAATLLFKMKQTSQTPKQTTESPIQTTTLLSTEISSTSGNIDIVTEGDKKVMDYVTEESSRSTTQNPTILIINDYANHISSETLNDGSKEGYRNLLLSIIQFETNSLNDEWGRVAYGVDRHRHETDIKRSILSPPKVTSVKSPAKLTPKTKVRRAEVTYEGGSDQDMSTKEPKSLLNKIVSKMGIKVVSNKKKVVKKATIREKKKQKKKVNFIRNRKLRINSYRQGNPTSPVEEACHTRRTPKPSQICDIQATYEYIQNLQKSLPAKIFETLVKNITCYKYKNADSIFTIPYKRQGKRWDWIRKKRSLKVNFYNKPNDDAFVVNFEDDSQESYEKFVKGGDGIYKIVQRKKRTANLEALERGLRNIPTLTPAEDEIFVMSGETVTLDCGLHTPVLTCDGKFKWKTDRKRMLKQNNVDVDGVRVTIHNMEPRNVGTYTCSLDHTVRRSLRLTVLTLPSFDIVFLPVYKTLENCSYDDLKAIQRLGGLMANETRCGKACSIRIDEPVCQRDKGTNSTLIRATAVISMTPRDLNCSLQCKRDIVSSLAMLCATNTAVLRSIAVLISKDGVNETLVPWKDFVRPVVTHTLRKKDTNGHHEYHELVPLLPPGKVHVVLICPAGYYLLPRYKLCSSCPPNTSSKAGDNTCRSCPRGTRAEPGAAVCRTVNTHQRRYDWWWYPPCGYLLACCCVLFGCSACVLLTVIVHFVSRDSDLRENEDGDDEEHKILKSLPRVTVAYAHPSARPLSPSRVILPRFFLASLTSSRATDSQETKFELWKERNRPPPLPPIDFDP